VRSTSDMSPIGLKALTNKHVLPLPWIQTSFAEIVNGIAFAACGRVALS